MSAVLAIAAGGALGALARHFLNIAVSTTLAQPFPFGTLTCNVLGSLVMGGLISYFAHVFNPPQEIKLFLLTGFLGAFTTFSAFSLDSMVLIERGAWSAFFAYTIGSVVLSIGAVLAGSWLIWKMTAAS